MPERGSESVAVRTRAPAPPEPVLPPPSMDDEPVPGFDVMSFRDGAGLPRPFIGLRRSQDALIDGLRHLTPTGFRPVGSTSTVFHMKLDGRYDAAFKSKTHDRPNGPAAEVAAYRLSRCLGLNNVPPAVSRRIPETALRAAFENQPGHTWEEISQRMVREHGDLVPGVAIYWIPKMVDLDIDDPAGIARWTGWLTQGEMIQAGSRSLAAHISTMVVFDYLIGNFDRFSGGNARGDEAGTLVFLRDHDVAFAVRLGQRVHKRILSRMLRAERFSASFYQALSELTRACFLAELARDPAWRGGRLLSEARIDGVFERLETAKSHIESLIQLHGRDEVLAFP